MTDFLIIDLDGCISDHAWRWNQIDHSETDPDIRFKEYNEKCDQDKPMNLELVWAILRSTQNLSPLIVTARPESVRAKTILWLFENFPVSIPSNHILMRGKNDLAHSPELKVKLIQNFLTENNHDWINTKVFAALDDRQDVLDAYANQVWSPILLAKQNPINELTKREPSQLDRIEDAITGRNRFQFPDGILALDLVDYSLPFADSDQDDDPGLDGL